LNNTKKLESWIDGLGFQEIRESECLQRLKHVRLLGTMRYIVELVSEPNRYDHSLNVAFLSYCYLEQLVVDEKDKLFSVLIALLHDIGHLPFSHASEVFFKEAWGKYHTSHGGRIARQLARVLELRSKNELAKMVNDASKYFQSRSKSNSTFNEIALDEVFHGVLSADTLDGIFKASSAIGLACPDPIKIVEGLYSDDDGMYMDAESGKLAHEFIRLKESIYNDYVYSAAGMAAEAMLTKALNLGFQELVDMDEFLRFDDNDALEQLLSSDRSRPLMVDLEERNIYYSMKEVGKEKYRLIKEVFTRDCHNVSRSASVARGIENELNGRIGDKERVNIIIHPTIRLRFPGRYEWQNGLFHMPIPLKAIERVGKTRKHYGIELEVVVHPECIDNLRNIRIKNSVSFVQHGTSITALRHRSTQNEKSKGAHPTPEMIVEYLAYWAINSKIQKILDPASGDGIFLKWSAKRLMELGLDHRKAVKRVFGIEREEFEWQESMNIVLEGTKLRKKNIIRRNFFDYINELQKEGLSPKYDVIIGNPPYIRADQFESRELAIRCCKEMRVNINGRVSSWAPYVICALSLLKDNGRMAMVLPFELLSTDYAKPVREYLSNRFSSLKFVFFKQSVFKSALQNVLLLLASNDSDPGIYKIEVKNENSLAKISKKNMIKVSNSQSWIKGKWTDILVDHRVHNIMLDSLKSDYVCNLSAIATIKIGLVTGANKKFVFNNSQVEKLKIGQNFLSPIVTRAVMLPGAIYSDEDFTKQCQEDLPSHLLSIPATANIKNDKNLKAYLDKCKRENVHLGYKCRTRWPWYSVPMQPSPDAFMTYMSHNQVRLVLNQTKVLSTNNIHNIYFSKEFDVNTRRAITTAFYSTLTQLSLELLGRGYGGGVLKIEPSEFRKGFIINPPMIKPEILMELSNMIEDVNSALLGGAKNVYSEIDDILLRKVLGLKPAQVRQLQNAYKYLRERRLMRNQ